MLEKNSKLISVIIPCFNSGLTVQKSVNSVVNQTWKDKEIILVNDGSTDKLTLFILKELSKIKILKLINQNNLGLSSARNKGIKESNGNYLFFLDADDWIEENCLEEMYFSLNKYKNFAYVYSDIITEGNFHKIIKNDFNFYQQLFLNKIPYSIFLNKKTLVVNGGYDDNMESGYEDWDLNIRLGAKNLFGKRIPKPLFHYKVSDSGMLLSKSIKNHTKIWKYIRNKNKELYQINNVLKIWIEWKFAKSNYPPLMIFIWFLVINYLPVTFSNRLFMALRKINVFLKRTIFKTN
tara:strand:- start:1595 stop:2473 length:879 start_codon:yes stop_codon:yes gene_type:complete